MATSLKIDRTTMRQLAAAMAFVMMIASLPAVGVVIVSDRSGPTISIDICHPPQSVGTSASATMIARPAHPELCARIDSREALVQFVPIPRIAFAEAPDPPPPKPLV